MFSRFKEKLSGFKEALSTKIQEKVSRAEEITGIKLDQKHEPEGKDAGKIIASPDPEIDTEKAFILVLA